MSTSRSQISEGELSILNKDNDVECERKRVLSEAKKYKRGDL